MGKDMSEHVRMRNTMFIKLESPRNYKRVITDTRPADNKVTVNFPETNKSLENAIVINFTSLIGRFLRKD